jgi:hypothetical protein
MFWNGQKKSLSCHFLFAFFAGGQDQQGRKRMYTVDRIFPAEPEEPSGGGGEEEPVLSPGVAGRRLVAAPSPRLRLVAKSGALNVISEHLTWWNPLSFNNAIRHLLLALPCTKGGYKEMSSLLADQ